MPIYGWDASDFDWGRGPMNVTAAAQDGIKFFTHKATEGTRTQHVHYGEAMRRARNAGIEFRGAYYVPRTPGNNGHGSIQAQVNYFLAYLDSQTAGWRGDPGFFLQVDLEHWGYDDVAPQHGVQAADLLRTQTGKWVVLYAPRWAYGDSIGGGHALWASAYGSNPAVHYRAGYPGDGSNGWAPYSGRTPTILQYGSRLTIGSQPGCDANAFRGTLDQFRALVTGSAKPTLEVPEMTPEEIRKATNGDSYLWGITQEADPIGEVVQPGGAKVTVANKPLQRAMRMEARLAALDAKVSQVAGGAVTQEMHSAAVLAAMQDPAVIAALGAAVASHIHVS